MQGEGGSLHARDCVLTSTRGIEAANVMARANTFVPAGLKVDRASWKAQRCDDSNETIATEIAVKKVASKSPRRPTGSGPWHGLLQCLSVTVWPPCFFHFRIRSFSTPSPSQPQLHSS